MCGGVGRPRSPPCRSRKGHAFLEDPAGGDPCTHLQGVSGDDQRTVVLPAEGVQLEVGLTAVGHLEGDRGLEEVLFSGDSRTTNSGFLEPV